MSEDQFKALKKAIKRLHGCDAERVRTETVIETYEGRPIWTGQVEVFSVSGHAQAKRCYAWSHLDGPKDERTRFVAVLEIPPVKSAETAVRVQIVKDTNQARKLAIASEVRGKK